MAKMVAANANNSKLSKSKAPGVVDPDSALLPLLVDGDGGSGQQSVQLSSKDRPCLLEYVDLS